MRRDLGCLSFREGGGGSVSIFLVCIVIPLLAPQTDNAGVGANWGFDILARGQSSLLSFRLLPSPKNWSR